MRTRFHGQLEGVTLEAKKMAQEAAKKQDVTAAVKQLRSQAKPHHIARLLDRKDDSGRIEE